MFKKSLLALAITGFAGAAAAATIPQAVTTFSSEGVANEVTIDANDFGDVVAVVALNNGYGIGDQIVFTFPNDTFDISTAASVTQDDSTLTFAAPAYSAGNTVSFTITGIGGALATDVVEIGDKFTLDGVILEGANLAGGGTVTASFKAVSSVNGTDYEAVTATVADTAAQIGVTIASGDVFAGVVDVNATRKLFVANAPTTTTTDELTVTGADAGGVLPATVNSTVYTLNGDFSFTDTDGDGTPNYGVTVSNATNEAIAADMQSITWTSTAGLAAHVVVITASNAGTPTTIPVQSFTVDTVASYDANTPNAGGVDSTKAISNAAGSWTLNGSSFTVPYMPYGANTKPILSITNTGSLSGEILISYMTETSTAWVEYDTNGLTSATGITNLKDTIDGIIAEIVAGDATATSGKLSLQVTVNAPDSAVSAFAAFKVQNANGESRVAIGTYGDLGTTKNNY
jgi:S-layer protein Slr4